MSRTDGPSLFARLHTGGWRPAHQDDPTQPMAPSNHTDTSRRAAASIRGSIGDREHLVLRLLRSRGRHGATNEELVALATEVGRPILLQSVCPTTNRLARRGLIVDAGQRRAGRSGRRAKVWRLSVIGEQFMGAPR